MTDPNTQPTPDGGTFPAATCSAIPRYFAGVYQIEETVSGGTGETPDDAVQDYVSNYADYEIDYYTSADEESGVITVEVFEVREVSQEEEENYGGWQWMCGKRVEKRDYAWSIARDAEVPLIVYVPNATAQGMTHKTTNLNDGENHE